MVISRAWAPYGIVTATLLAACSTGAGGAGEDVGSTGAAATTTCAAGTVTKGIDVSHYQGTVPWTTVKADGIDFAFAKATESNDYIDPDFATNWSGMKAAGVVRGAYHFFDSAVDGATQASYCLATVGTLDSGDLPVVLDFETLNSVAEATAVANAVKFLAAVTASTGKTAILYMSSDFLSGSYPALDPYTLWVANYGVSCPGVPSEWSTWKFWQDSATGSVSGISGAVDLDDFNGPLSLLTGGGSSGGSSSGSSSGASSSGSSSGSSGGSSSGSSSGGGSSGGSSSGSSSSGTVGGSSGSSSGANVGSSGAATGDAGTGGNGVASPEPFASTGGSGCAVGTSPSRPAPGVLLMTVCAVLLFRRRNEQRARA